MVRKKDSFWEHANDLKNGRFSCNFCKKEFPGGITRIKSHLSGVSGQDIQICQQVPLDIQFKAQEVIGTPSKRAKCMAAPSLAKRAKCMAASSNDQDIESVLGSSSSSHMLNLGKGHDKSKVDKQFAKFVILDRICSDAIQSPLFKDFVNGVAEHGIGYKLPSCSTCKSQLMPDIKKEVEEYRKNVIKYSIKTGCTLIKKSFSMFEDIVFAYTPIGVACMDPRTLVSFQQNSLKRKIFSVIELIGATNVVQVISDKSDDYEKCLLDIQYPWIYWTSCAAREIGSLLDKIYHVPWVYNTLKVAEWIVLYIYRNKVNVSLRRVQRKKHLIVSHFFRLLSLLEVQSELQSLQVSFLTCSSDWGMQLNKEQTTQLLGRAMFIEDVICCKEFWSRGIMLSPVLQSLLQAHFLVQRDGSTSGYLYEMIERVKDAVNQCCDSNYALYKDMWELLYEAQKKIIHPIHAAAAFLNPIYMCSEKFKENGEMKKGVNHILERLVVMEEKEAFKKQEELYRTKDSNVFTNEAMQMFKTYHPRIWWERYGNHLPVLQKYAIRILGQPCSSTCNSSMREDFDKEDYAFMVNTMMMEKYKSLETQMNEPIIFEKLCEVSDDDRDDDWEDEYEKSFGEFDLCYDDSILKDTSGSWLDGWPRQARRQAREQASILKHTSGSWLDGWTRQDRQLARQQDGILKDTSGSRLDGGPRQARQARQRPKGRSLILDSLFCD